MLDRELVEEVLRAARRRGGSFAELFVEEKTSTSIRLDDGKVEGSRPASIAAPASASAWGRRTATRTPIGWIARHCSPRPRQRSAALREGEAGGVVDLRVIVGSAVNPVERPADALPAADKVAWLRRSTCGAFLQPEVTQVVGVYGDSLQRVLIATSDGLWVEESRPRIRLVAQVVAARDGTSRRVPRAGRVQRDRVRRPASAAGRPRSPRVAPSRCWTRSRRRRGR
jgi:TldD protein